MPEPRLYGSRDRPTTEHELIIRGFLYDEGPHQLPDIALQVDLSERRCHDILVLMREAGEIVQQPLGEDGKLYWILAEDAHSSV